MSTQPTPVVVIAQLNARLQPLDRGHIFEDPLSERLEAKGLGQVVGGGTQLLETGEISRCDFEIELINADDATLKRLVAILEELGIPKGSKLLVGSDKEISCGTMEGLAVYLNGTDLPEEVYETCDVNYVCEQFDHLAEGVGEILGYWEGPTETALYLYGRSSSEIHKRLHRFLDQYPLCQKARVVQIA